MEELPNIIPEEEKQLLEILLETDYPRETLMDYIGWPTDQWHWDALSAISGRDYYMLKKELEPED